MYRKTIKKYDKTKNDPKYCDYLIKSVFTEKSTKLETSNLIVSFYADNRMNKTMAKAAIEKIFNTEVIGVSVCNVPGKTKFFRGKRGKYYHTAPRKKIMLRLKSAPDLKEIL